MNGPLKLKGNRGLCQIMRDYIWYVIHDLFTLSGGRVGMGGHQDFENRAFAAG